MHEFARLSASSAQGDAPHLTSHGKFGGNTRGRGRYQHGAKQMTSGQDGGNKGGGEMDMGGQRMEGEGDEHDDGELTRGRIDGHPGERRRHRRFRLGVAVNLHIGGRANPVVVEIVDIGVRGARFRAQPPPLRIEEEAAFGFVSTGPDVQHICVANGRVLRIGGDGDFVLSVERANVAFHNFLAALAS
jgi:hypothetical protein